jgi:L-threonylcarbamoyladenylate synthase
MAIALLRATGRPVVAPSANRAGRVSPTSAADVRRELGRRVALILDGGRCRVGVESTVIDLSGARPLLLRPGGITKAAAEAVLGERLRRAAPVAGDAARTSPGQLASHYAPRAAVRLGAAGPRAGEAYLGFGGLPKGRSDAALDLSPRRDLTEAAANLFAMLRALDLSGASTIAVAPIPRRGLGLAINDRLERAAAPR